MPTERKQYAHSYVPASSPYATTRKVVASKTKTRRIVIIVAILLLIIFALTASTAYAGFSFYQSYQTITSEIEPLKQDLDEFTEAVKTGDTATIQRTSDDISQRVSTMKEATQGPLWDIAEYIPVYGEDVRAARQLLNVADDLVQSTLVPLTPILTTYPRQSITDNGHLNSDAVQAYCMALSSIEPNIRAASEQLDTIHSPHFDQINNAVTTISRPLDKVTHILDTYGEIIDDLPYILGCYTPRNYLVVALNNDELASLGGFAGAMIPVTVANGRIEVGNVFSREDFVEDGSIPMDLTAEEGELFAFVGYSIGNIAMIPDFSRAASAWNKFWIADYGISYDGIISIDPVMLQNIVGLIGDITMPDGNVLTGTSTARILLHDVYTYFPNDNESQDYYFALAANSITAKLVNGGIGNIDISEMVDLIKDGMNEGRLHVWMANPDEQKSLESIGATGTLFDDSANPTLAVYLNDNTWSKIDWWISHATTISDPVDNGDGTVTYSVITAITNTASWYDIWNASHYEYGFSDEKYSDGDMISIVYIYAPMGGHFSDFATGDGTELTLTEDGGHQVIWGKFHTGPEETDHIYYTVTVAKSAAPMGVYVTPTAEVARNS